MVERIYFDGYVVGWRSESYTRVPATVQDRFIKLINDLDPDELDEAKEEIKVLQRELESVNQELSDADEGWRLERNELKEEIRRLEKELENGE